MRKHEELTNSNSCMSKARDNEWTFVLLGRDFAAPLAVLAWIAERIRLGKNTDDDPQIAEAQQWVASVLGEQGRQLDFIDVVRHSGVSPEQKSEWEREVTDELRRKNQELMAILTKLSGERGALVSSADCSEMEIAFARTEGRFFTDENGSGYVLRMREWRANAEAALHDVAELHRREKATFEDDVS